MKYCQKNFGNPPTWKLLCENGPVNAREFSIGVTDRLGKIVASANGCKKIEAEQRASKYALIFYGEIDLDEAESEDEQDDFETDDDFH